VLVGHPRGRRAFLCSGHDRPVAGRVSARRAGGSSPDTPFGSGAGPLPGSLVGGGRADAPGDPDPLVGQDRRRDRPGAWSGAVGTHGACSSAPGGADPGGVDGRGGPGVRALRGVRPQRDLDRRRARRPLGAPPSGGWLQTGEAVRAGRRLQPAVGAWAVDDRGEHPGRPGGAALGDRPPGGAPNPARRQWRPLRQSSAGPGVRGARGAPGALQALRPPVMWPIAMRLGCNEMASIGHI
jgi:hypothetical protein